MLQLNYKTLSVAREARGMTQAELATNCQIQQSNYSKMEKGLLPVPEETLNKIADTLNFHKGFFFKPTLLTEASDYLYRKRASMARKPQIKLEATFDLLKIWVEELLHGIEIPDFDIPAIEVYSTNTPETIARKVRLLMKVERGPIDQLVSLIEQHGIIVYFLKNAPEKFDGVSLITKSGQRIIVINEDYSNDRKRFTLAHELGHIIMHLPFTPIIDPDRDLENEANRFASEFLLPELDAKRDLIRFRMSILGDLKSFWKVSKAFLIKRAYDLHYIDSSKYTNMMIELSRMGERKVEKREVSLDSPRLLSMVINAYLEDLNYTKQELCDVLCITPEDLSGFLLGVDQRQALFKIVI